MRVTTVHTSYEVFSVPAKRNFTVTVGDHTTTFKGATLVYVGSKNLTVCDREGALGRFPIKRVKDFTYFRK